MDMIKNEYSLLGITMALLALPVMAAAQNAHPHDGHYRSDSTSLQRTQRIGEVVVHGKYVDRVNKSAYNAVAIDTRKLRNTNLDLAHALDRVAGIKIREEGGVGSSVQLNLNGFTGQHVKVFIDGMPMDNSNTSFGLNNIPAGFASQLQVYKGVVPVDFGGDAIGGVINIVTDHSPRTYIDASYSYGSFNTHRSNLALGWTSKQGFMIRFNAYQNYSDNDYKVKTQWTDLSTSTISNDERWFRRFHDRYHNEAVILQAGLVNKSWANKLLFGLQYSHEYAQIQNANLMKIVFGGKLRKNWGITPTLLYEKRNLFTRGLNLRVSARYDYTTTNNVDTLSRTYSWTGDWIPKASQGEGATSLAEFTGKTLTAVANLTYRIGDQHFFTLNETYVNFHRHTTENAANRAMTSTATFMRRINIKDITGLSYQFIPNNVWNVTAFLKYYDTHVTGPVNIATTTRAEYEEQKRHNHARGFGAAGTWTPDFLRDLQVKLSYERALRLPTERELFGDGDYEEGDAILKPEKSNNINLNFNYEHTFADAHTIVADLGLNYRNVQDYIIRTINSKGVAVSTNHGHVVGQGFDATIHYLYKDIFTIGGNYSMQNMRNRERYNSNGALSVTYNNRVPNLPYAFGNMDASYTLKHVLGKYNKLTIGYDMRYVHRFYRSWSGDGAKLYVPEQYSHDANLTYSIYGGRYNISFEANNFTNSLLYDNYSLQKPGRNFAVKFRYVWSK